MSVDPGIRTEVVMKKFAVTLAQVMDMHPGVRLTLRDGRWQCDEVSHDVWFGNVFLAIIRQRNSWSMPIDPWSYADGIVRLDAANGSWRWRLTGETREGENSDGPLPQLRGVWPD